MGKDKCSGCKLPVGEGCIRAANASATTFIHVCFCCVAVYKRIVCPASTPAWRKDEHNEDARLYAEFAVKHQFAIRVSTLISTL